MPERPTQREYWNSKVGDEWARQADRTDAMFADLTLAAFEALDLQQGEHVLDIGCGAGASSLMAAQRVGQGGRVVGVDISRPLLERARQRAREAGVEIDFIDADAGAAIIAGAPFDAVFSRFGMMFFENPAAAFAQIRNNVGSAGRLVFVCWRPFSENAWASAPLAALAPLLNAPPPAPDESLPGPFALADAAKIGAVLERSGWREPAIAPWDGLLRLGADAEDAAGFSLRIGPCARAVADYGLDAQEAKKMVAAHLAGAEGREGVLLPGACWIVQARA